MSKFSEAVKRSAEKHWTDDAKSAEQNTGGKITLDEGSYIGRLSYEAEVISSGTLKGIPVLLETITVTEGDFAGRSVQKKMLLGGDYAEKAFKQCSARLKAVFPHDAADIAALDHEGIADYLETVIDQEVLVRFQVIETKIENREDKSKMDTVKYTTIDGPMDEDDAPAPPKAKAKPAPEPEEDEEDEEPAPKPKRGRKPAPEPEEDEEDEEDEADDEDEPWMPAKGDTVLHKAKGKRVAREYTVASINRTKGTVTIADDDGEKITVDLETVQPAD